ncbi:MAG: hypothetical protein HC815_17185 [Richelia sp. RM1_1_1]|nr:hypothetical protein [Richelia sp. RM1_1_1]
MSSESNFLDNINTKSTSDNPVLAARDAKEDGADKSFHSDGLDYNNSDDSARENSEGSGNNNDSNSSNSESNTNESSSSGSGSK